MVLASSLGGCGAKQPGASGGIATPPRGQPTATKRIGPPLSDEECRTFAASFEKAVLSNDLVALSDMFDWDAFLATATAGIEVSERFKQDFATGFKHAQTQKGAVFQQVIEAVTNGGTFKFLRVHTIKPHKRAMFRMTLPGAGFNYHDWVLARRPDGRIRGVDVYVFLSAELMSKTIRRAYLPLAAHESRGIVAKLTGQEQEFVKHLPQLMAMSDHLKEGRFREVLDTYRQLPHGLKIDKNFLLVRFQAAPNLGDEEYTAVIEDFRKYHPDDPCLDILSIDTSILKKDYAKALASIDRLDKAVGGDPYLDTRRADVYLEDQKPDAAKQAARRAIEREPNLIDAYWSLVAISLKEREFAETLELLNILGEKFDIVIEDLDTIPDYAGFVESPHYQQWLKARSKE